MMVTFSLSTTKPLEGGYMYVPSGSADVAHFSRNSAGQSEPKREYVRSSVRSGNLVGYLTGPSRESPQT